MAIESATYLSDLNVANPPGSDPVGQADDHIRLLKSVLKSTFPNISGPVTPTQSQLNGGLIPTGCILMWSGSIASIPSGFALCDGASYPRSDGSGNVTTPNLSGRFVVAASTSLAPGTVGGTTSSTPIITITNEPVALTTNQLPAHTHANTLNDTGHTHSLTDPGHSHSTAININGDAPYQKLGSGYATNGGTYATNSATTGITIASSTTNISITNASVGSGATHVHNNTASSSAVSIIPPYYALCYIYKL